MEGSELICSFSFSCSSASSTQVSHTTTTTKDSVSSTSSLTFPKKILSSNTEEILSFSTSKEKNGFAPSPS